MKICIIGAMEEEITQLKNCLKKPKIEQQAGYKIYIGQLHGIEIALVKSGIGKVAAALGTTLLLNRFEPELVINTGAAGSLAPLLTVGDIVIPHELRYHDVDLTAFGYELGQMAQCPVSFNVPPSLVKLTEEIIGRLGMHAVYGLMVTGDAFINGAVGLSRICQAFPQAIAVEMEATAIAHVCHHFSVPFIAVRVISDFADHLSHLSFKTFLTAASQRSSRLVEQMVQAISRQRQ
ncbi:5'-methylthioadenosine/S-adenosylhomocysteine nucleosidase [secondary endosymbiont of Ctenarytaina eucalypti]|uniref:5'-methylthioadenosine/S-adenosylhomocysteine nucleosidase n=1 Tax=secondary endosymbiont of Ctenarytaina eucalypti TaxID=1199245 RepID=J3YRR2_9ENTR|nr:5'-methylthioadenosine/S-adenosylhomocysteine nucleosidase [secondary endosymbiont of Ctenarytaina eucalypti]AFP84788.1 5''-methylthioadenosine/S-adenosylhomocysteine nucleosidase [secondary endosymbiont of Ctenarytaina eucalypti]